MIRTLLVPTVALVALATARPALTDDLATSTVYSTSGTAYGTAYGNTYGTTSYQGARLSDVPAAGSDWTLSDSYLPRRRVEAVTASPTAYVTTGPRPVYVRPPTPSYAAPQYAPRYAYRPAYPTYGDDSSAYAYPCRCGRWSR